MRKRCILCVLLTFVLLNMSVLLAQQNPEDTKFQKTLETYFDELWKFYPTAATLAGFYKYNDKLEDLSNKSIEKRHDALDKFNQEFVAKVDKTKLSPDIQIDYEMIIDAIDLELLKHENIIPWEYDPLFYNEIFLDAVRGLLVKEFAPLDARLRSATERAKQLPGLLKQARENLKTPPQLFTETALKQLPGILDFYRNEIPRLTENAPADLKSRFQGELNKVLAGLEEYQRFLQNDLLPRSTGNFRIGDQAHLRLLRLTAQGSIPIDELVARARADYNNIRREMFLVCIPFYRIMYPHINLEQLTTQRGEEEVRNIVIIGVLDKIKGEHVTKEEFISQANSNLDRIKEFVGRNQFFELPGQSLTIEPMPLASRGITWTRLIGPGLYETTGEYTAQISPLPDEWNADQANSFLEEYNNFYLNFWTVRKIFPGQFVPIFFTRRFPSLVRKMYPNQALIKGWPVYVEEMLVLAGYGNYDLRLRLNQLKLQLKDVIDFNLELNIHQGGMTKEQAITYMTRGGFQTQAEAERKWNRILLKPGDSAYPYIGIQEISDIEKDYKKLKGDAFSQKEFLQKLLGCGAIPLRHLKAKLAQ